MTSTSALNARLSFIGGGNMASSIIGGLLNQGFDAKAITVSDPYQPSLDKLAKLGVNITQNNTNAIANSDVVVLAVKPQIMQQVCKPLDLPANCMPMIISIAAGITTVKLSEWLGDNTPIVRCMPNTPALVGLGATALFANVRVSAAQRQLAEAILSAVGISLWVDKEQQLDAVTALSGSGPAYFFLLIEAMQQAGEQLGLSKEIAAKLTLQTALGAATMASQSNVDAAELRRQVTSPNGTTEAAIKRFMADNFNTNVQHAMSAAKQRSEQLAAELD